MFINFHKFKKSLFYVDFIEIIKTLLKYARGQNIVLNDNVYQQRIRYFLNFDKTTLRFSNILDIFRDFGTMPSLNVPSNSKLFF